MLTILKNFILSLLCITYVLPAPNQSVISFNEERDLEVFESLNKSHEGVWKKFDHTLTKLGQQSLKNFFKNPTTNVAELRRRQQILQTNPESQQSIVQALESFGMHEFGLDTTQIQENAVAQTVIKNFYFQYPLLKGLNKSPLALDIKQTFKTLGIFSPVLEHLILHFALDHIHHKIGGKKETHEHHDCEHGHEHDDHHDCDHDHDHHGGHHCIHDLKPAHGASSFIKGLFFVIKAGHFAFHALSIKEMVEYVQQQIAVVNTLHKQVAAAKICFESMEKIDQIIKNDAQLLENFGAKNPIAQLFDGSATGALKDLIELLSDNKFDINDDLSWFSSLGKTLRAYQLLNDALPMLQPALDMVGDIDAYLSVAQHVQENSNNAARFCYVDFILDNKNPQLSMKNFWNIMLDSHAVILNDITIGTEQEPTKYIITGPNKAGKSSLIKAVGLNTLLAQTFGIAAAHAVSMTPFTKIITYITVTDDITNDTSTLVAEILRADQCLKTLDSLSLNQFALVIIDDSLFKGTTYEKGQEAAYQFIKHIGYQGNCIAFVATHLPRLTKLEAENNDFGNYRIKLTKNFAGKSISSFTLERGVSAPDHVFELVEAQGYRTAW